MAAILKLLRQIFSLGNFKTTAQSTLMVQHLTRIIGVVSPDQKLRIQKLSQPQMDALAQAADNFSTPEDLDAWLRSQNV